MNRLASWIVVEPLIPVLAGVAILLFTALAITVSRSRRRRPVPRAERPPFDRDPAEVAIPAPTPAALSSTEEPAVREQAANGDRRQPVTVAAGTTLELTSSSPTAPPLSTGSLANRTAPSPSPPAPGDTPRAILFWSLFDPDAEMDENSGPVCFAVDGVTADGVLDLVRMDFETRGFVVRQERPDRLRAHQGPAVLHATVRSVHTGLTRQGGAYRGTPQPFVVVEIEVPPAQPPLPTSPVVRFS